MGKFVALPNTDWKLVEAAGAATSVSQKQALQTLLVQYLPALQAHLLSKWRVSLEQAEELLQEFLADKIVASNLIGQANQQKGRFRNFIRTTLDAFVVSKWRSQGAKKRLADKMTAIALAEDAVDPGADPSQAFTIAWAREVIAAAIAGTERECEAAGRADLWGLFRHRVLSPAIEGVPAAPYAALIEEFHFCSPLQAANALTTAKRMFERNLREVLRQYATNDQEVEEEIRDLQAILADGHA